MPHPPESWTNEEIITWRDITIGQRLDEAFFDETAQLYFHAGWYQPEIALYHIREARQQMQEYMADIYGVDFTHDFMDWAAWRVFMGY